MRLQRGGGNWVIAEQSAPAAAFDPQHRMLERMGM